MKEVFIINPNAGKGKQIEILKNNIEMCFNNAIVYELKKNDDIIKITKSYCRNDVKTIFACGGDGTLNKVLNGIVGHDINLGIIPMGTGNDFVKSLPYSREALFDLNNYQNCVIKPIDIMSINETYYGINTVSVGLDVTIAKNVEKFKRVRFTDSTLPYYMSLIYSMKSGLDHELTIFIDDKLVNNNHFSFVVCGNGGYYGGGYHPTPDSKYDDGILDMCLIKKVTRTRIIQLSKAYKTGKHIEHQDIVSISKGKKMRIIASDNLSLNIDGEVLTFKNPEIKLIEQGVKLLLPSIEK